MTKLAKIMCCVTLPLALLFGWVGYAALSATLSIQGSAQAERPNAVYIAQVTIDANTYTHNAVASAIDGYSGDPTEVDFPSTKFMCNINYKAQNSYITFKVTVVNGTGTTQYFNGVTKPTVDASQGYNYSGIKDETKWGQLSGGGWGQITTYNPSVLPSLGHELKSGETCEFTVTIKCSETGVRKTLYELSFAPDFKEVTQQVSLSIIDKYDDLLNDNTKYNAVAQYMSYGISSSDKTGGYISNCQDYAQNQKDAVNAVFGDDVQIEINGKMQRVTILLKQDNVGSWNNGARNAADREERMIFFTADPLDQQGATVPVFVCVFYKENGEWLPVGTQFRDEDGNPKYWILEGTATVCNQSGGNGTGNFQTGDWKSTESYFNLGSNKTLAELMGACDP